MKVKLIFSLFVFVLLIFDNNSNAQSGKVPPFRIIQPNGKIFKAENLPFEKPILIVYFSPDCEDCQEFTEGLLAHNMELKNVSIALITYLPVEFVTQFVAKNNLKVYPNIYVGTEGNSLFIKNYYGIEQFPFVVLFNKNGDLIKKYSNREVNINDLLIQLKKL